MNLPTLGFVLKPGASALRKEVKQMSYTRKAGRDADNGQFIPVKEARDRDSTATVEHITYPGARKGTPSKRK